MSDTGWIVIGAIAIVSIILFRKEIRSFLNRVKGVKGKHGGIEFEIQTTTTPLGETNISNPAISETAYEPVGTHISYVDETHSFRIRWPAGGEWIKNDAMAATLGANLLIVYYQSFGDFTPNVNVTIEEIGDTSLNTWLRLGNQEFERLGYTVLETSQDPLSRSAVRVVRKEDNGGTLYQIQRVILLCSRAYVATGSKLEADYAAFPKLYGQMREILNSFQVL